ncbi:hypothetical protein [Streptomyces brasiliscabiei]|uniref:hypothetical protein n=1 Tax=Streptomyces brasiliscabiei TaxID=2736302 RepID=UPI001C11F132|nr:hypothetical protein [Streptomyces brasiliscabiei]
MLTLSRPRADRPARSRPRRSLLKTLVSAGVAARAALFVALGVIALSLSAPQSAKALFDTCDWTSDSINQMADMPGAAENIFPSVQQWSGKRELVSGAVRLPGDAGDYTVYELGAMRGLNWSSTQQSRDQAKQGDRGEKAGDDDCSVQNEIYNSIAQMVFDLSKFITRGSISIKEISSNPSPLAALYEGTVEGDNSVVDRLNDNVFKLAVPTMIMLTGLWVFGKWRKGDVREVWAGVGWAAFVVIAVSAFLVDNNYTRVVETADSGIAQGNAALTEAVLGGAVDDIDPPCDLAANAPQRGMRISSCAMYDTLAFRPWAIGQFGDPGKKRMEYKGSETCDFGEKARCTDLRAKQVNVQSVTNFDYYKDWSEVDGGVIKHKENQYGELRNYIAKNEKSRVYEQWSGHKPGNRITMGIYALIASLIVGIMVVVLSALTLLWHSVTLIMIILLPLVAIISIHPTQQKLLRGWWQTFVHSFVLRAGFGVILTVLLLFYQLILPLAVPLGMQLLMLLLVTISVVMLLKNLLSGKFSPQVAGAEDALGVADAASKATAMAPGLAVSTAQTTARTTGRVAGSTAKGVGRAGASTARGTAWAADQLFAKGKYRGKLQQKGWLGQSKREQNQSAYWAKEDARTARADRAARVGNNGSVPPPQPEPEQEPEGQDPARPRRGGRVSGSSGTSAPTTGSTPTAPAPRPEPQPQPAPSPRPSRPAPADPTPPTPPPAPRDPRGPSGRV